jgi:hypothetical protein
MRCLLLCLASVALTACAFEPGDPWASATFDLTGVFDEAGRSQDGGLRTAQDYRVELDTVEVRVTSARINLAAEDAADFDPANPPLGFSLCHNGHCHAEDGSLVAYADIAAEGASGADSTVQAVDAVVALDDSAQSLPLGPCSSDCNVPRGALRDVQIDVAVVRLVGRAFDSRDVSRLPEDGVAFDVHWEPPSLRSPADGQVGEGESPKVRVDGVLTVSARALDAIDFAAVPQETLTDVDGLDWTATVRR